MIAFQERRRCDSYQQEQQRLLLLQLQGRGELVFRPMASNPTVVASYELPADEDALIAQVLQLQSCPFSCLGLARRTPVEAARKRYLQLALRLHPDKCGHREARVAFAAAGRAYRLICRQ